MTCGRTNPEIGVTESPTHFVVLVSDIERSPFLVQISTAHCKVPDVTAILAASLRSIERFVTLLKQNKLRFIKSMTYSLFKIVNARAAISSFKLLLYTTAGWVNPSVYHSYDRRGSSAWHIWLDSKLDEFVGE